jgi:hypothetical protein
MPFLCVTRGLCWCALAGGAVLSSQRGCLVAWSVASVAVWWRGLLPAWPFGGVVCCQPGLLVA